MQCTLLHAPVLYMTKNIQYACALDINVEACSCSHTAFCSMQHVSHEPCAKMHIPPGKSADFSLATCRAAATYHVKRWAISGFRTACSTNLTHDIPLRNKIKPCGFEGYHQSRKKATFLGIDRNLLPRLPLRQHHLLYLLPFRLCPQLPQRHPLCCILY